MRTERMWASYRVRLRAPKRSISTPSRPKAWMTRTPVMPSCSDDSIVPMRSRTER